MQWILHNPKGCYIDAMSIDEARMLYKLHELVINHGKKIAYIYVYTMAM